MGVFSKLQNIFAWVVFFQMQNIFAWIIFFQMQNTFARTVFFQFQNIHISMFIRMELRMYHVPTAHSEVSLSYQSATSFNTKSAKRPTSNSQVCLFAQSTELIQSLGNTFPTPPLAPISFPFSGNKRQEGQQQVIVFQETKTLPVADRDRKAVNSNCQKFSFRVKNLNQEKDIFCSLIHRGHLIGILREILYPITLLSTN